MILTGRSECFFSFRTFGRGKSLPFLATAPLRSQSPVTLQGSEAESEWQWRLPGVSLEKRVREEAQEKGSCTCSFKVSPSPSLGKDENGAHFLPPPPTHFLSLLQEYAVSHSSSECRIPAQINRCCCTALASDTRTREEKLTAPERLQKQTGTLRKGSA